MNDPTLYSARTTDQRPQRPKRVSRVRLLALLLLLPMLLVVLTSLLLFAPSSVSAQAITDGPAPSASQVPFTRVMQPTGEPSCVGQGCNFTNPYATECAGQSWDSWWVVLSGYLRDNHGNIGGYVQLWWSATCQTNWTRIVSYSYPSQTQAVIDLQNGEGESNQARTQIIISDQFYAPSALACSYGAIWLGSGRPTYTGQVSQYQGNC
jgi:hypothetical protein